MPAGAVKSATSVLSKIVRGNEKKQEQEVNFNFHQRKEDVLFPLELEGIPQNCILIFS